MSSIGSVNFRTTTLLSSDNLLASLRKTQAGLLEAQNEISSGKSVQRPGDAPAKASSILLLQGQLQARVQHDQNVQFASGVLNTTDAALSDATDIVREAQGIASSQVGVGSSTDTRKNQATVVDAQISSLIELANRSFQGVPLFGGDQAPADGQPFVEFLGGVRYVGSRTNLQGDIGLNAPLAINTNGVDAFGALSTRVQSKADLNPQATTDTLISDVNGAQSQGIRRGSIVVTVDGTATVVDLSDADTLGDVATRVNNAINGVDPTAGSLAVGGNGFSLTAAAGHTVSIAELGTGQTAGDLGIATSASGATVTGGDIDPRLTERTSLAALGVPIDFTSGLKITQGNQTKIADLSGATTVRDVINTLQQLGLGLRAEVNDDGTAINVVSEVSGISLSIGEVSGGTTATDLGLRTFGTDTALNDLNFGLGIHRTVGQDDFRLQLHDGTTFNVNLDGATSVEDVLTKISAAASAAGVTVGAPGAAGTGFNVGLASDGNGITLEDGTAGGANFRVVQLGTSLAATDLGIYTDAQAGNTISGTDVAGVKADSVFTHLIALRNALVNDDSSGITLAGTGIEKSIDQIVQARADVGVRAQRVQQQQERSADLKLSEQSLLSDLQDSDLTEVITRFTALQQQLQASLQVGAQNLQLSLFDFLR